MSDNDSSLSSIQDLPEGQHTFAPDAAFDPPDPSTVPTAEPALWSVWDVGWITLGIVVVFGLGFLAARLWLRPWMAGGTAGTLPPQQMVLFSAGLAGWEGAVLLGCVYFLGLRRRGYTWQQVGLGRLSGSWGCLGLGLGALAIPGSALVAVLIQLVLGQALDNPQLPFIAPAGFSWFGAISMFILVGLLVPLAEELYFRAVLYRWLRQRWGMWIGVAVSALIFGALHGDIAVGGAAAVLGAVLALVYEYSHSLWPSFLVHAINNAVKVFLLYLLLGTGMLNL